MAERRFDITFNGTVTEGYSVDTVKNNIKQLFKLDDQAVDHMFSGKQVVIKKNLDRQTASRYQAALLKAGAKIQLAMHQSSSTNGASNTTNASPVNAEEAIRTETSSNQTSASSQTTSSQSSSLEALPNSGDLLRDDEKTPFVASDIPTEHISAQVPADEENVLVASGDQDMTQEYAPRYPGFDHIQLETNLTLADAGADLLNDDEKKRFQEAEVDISRLSIAED